MPDDLSFLDQLEEWLENQVPNNLHELPYKMLETVENITNELFETLNIHGPPSISIPFPPFGNKEIPPPAPPPPPPPPSGLPVFCHGAYFKSEKYIREHPLAVGTALSVGLGLTGLAVYKYTNILDGFGKQLKLRRKFGVKGRIEDGMLKEAIVILAPSPMPPLLVPLAASLLRAGYIVLVSVPNTKDADQLERRLSSLEEKSALRVLIYDPDDINTFPPFHRSLLATLTLRFPESGKYPSGDPYNPSPAHLPHIHAYISLYPLNPSPPSQPGGLPALPTLLSPNLDGTTPMLINFYPSTSLLPTPNSFASQLLTSNHILLGRNLSASSGARIVSIYVGEIVLPTLPAILSGGKSLTRRQAAKERLLSNASTTAKVSIIKDYLFGSVSVLFGNIIGTLGLGNRVKSYDNFEKRVLRIIKSPSFQPLEGLREDRYSIGGKSFLPLFLAKLNLPPFFLPKLLSILPTLPMATGPTHPPLSRGINPKDFNYSAHSDKPKTPTSASTTSASANSSDHEGGEDLISSIHTGTSTTNSSRSGSGNGELESEGLEGSWVGLDSAN
ncbi:uncharacterized protein IL334_003217 [Kwoniella shivajii]|uniref:DUF1776-domain-containing protein n=1 Tax=Kwoniella shivajii TaxID=564305 RepID=A0ABZ1CWX8_9TREE|nr:hypothetical protein IL334_003217 [Kwoniella shivajii]